MEHDPAVSEAAVAPAPQPGCSGRLRRLGRDYAYVLPGLPISVISFSVLTALTATSLGSFVVWIGALLMPLTLLVASGFAGLSRRRLWAWGMAATANYRQRRRGVTGAVQLMADPRRWLDLAFEMIIAFPLRLLTFVIAVTWTGVALAGLTYWFWWQFIPADGAGWAHLLSWGFPELMPYREPGLHLLESAINLAVGLVFLASLPVVMRRLATLDARLTAALLTGDDAAHPVRSGDDADRPTGTRPYQRPRPDRRHPAALSGTGWAWVGTTYAAVVLIAVGWPVLAAVYGVHPAVAMVLAIGHSASLVVVVRWVRTGIGLSALAALGTMLATSAVAAETPWPWPVTAMLTQCLVVTVVALRHSWFWAVTAWTAGVLLTVAAFALVAGEISGGGLANGIVLVSVTAGLALLGILEQLWRRSARRVQRAEELSVEETARRQDLEKRNRIARELHDVVAHSMSVINVQASTAQYRKPGIDAAIQREFDDIAESSRQALGEMRALLAILRNDDAAPTAPVPTLTDIQGLVEATRASGASISYSGVEAEVAPTVGLTAFRVIQEALSNALRHAPGAAIEVTTAIDEGGQALVVNVVNSAATSDTAATPGAGLGLAGIRERVATLGATVEAGPTPSGGFRVSTSLPLGGGRNGAT